MQGIVIRMTGDLPLKDLPGILFQAAYPCKKLFTIHFSTHNEMNPKVFVQFFLVGAFQNWILYIFHYKDGS